LAIHAFHQHLIVDQIWSTATKPTTRQTQILQQKKNKNVEVLGGVRLDSTSSSIKKEWMIVPENSKQEENTEKCIVNNKGLQTHYPSRSNR
jgi:hypothetical protein